MRDTSQRGLGSDNMSEEQKRRIRSEGGKKSPQNFANDPEFASKVAQRSKGGRASRSGSGDSSSGDRSEE